MSRMSRVASVIAGVIALAPAGSAAAETHVSGEVGGQSWTPAGSPYIVDAPLTVAAGSTLTIAAGTSVSSSLPSASALVVNGAITVAGTPENPATFDGPGPTVIQAGWSAIQIAGTGAATLAGAVFRGWSSGVVSFGTLAVRSCVFEGNAFAGVEIFGGEAMIDAAVVRANGNGVMVWRATMVSITNTLVLAASLDGIGVNGGTVSIVNCTIDGGQYGVYASAGIVGVRNTIITNATEYGIQMQGANPPSAPRTTIATSDIFGSRAGNYDNVVPGPGCISVDPSYAGASDYHLRAASACIDSGAAPIAPDHDLDLMPRPAGSGIDMGAYEYRAEGGAGGGAGTSGGAGGGGGAAGGAGSPALDAAADAPGSKGPQSGCSCGVAAAPHHSMIALGLVVLCATRRRNRQGVRAGGPRA